MIVVENWKLELIQQFNVATVLPRRKCFVLPIPGDTKMCPPEENLPALLWLDCPVEESQRTYARFIELLKQNQQPLKISLEQKEEPRSFLVHGVGLETTGVYLLGHVSLNSFIPKPISPQ